MPRGSEKPGEVPPGYEEYPLDNRGHRQPDTSSPPLWDPRYWSKKVWIGIAAVVVIAIVIGVAVGVTQGKKKSYPDYSQLTYTLKDTCESYTHSLLLLDNIYIHADHCEIIVQGENFFDNFNYYTGYDPAQGFVHYVPQVQAQQMVSHHSRISQLLVLHIQHP